MERKIYRILFLTIPLLLLTLSCQDKKKSEAEKIVKTWVGKEVKFPDNARCTIMGQDTLCSELFEKPYKILVYIDSLGCTSCKLRLQEWKRMINEADSIAPDKIGFLFFFNPKSEKELLFMLKRDQMDYPVFIDTKNEIQALNQFPSNMMYQSFLLDQNNRVLLIGNPSMNPQVWDLYKQQMTGSRAENSISITSVNIERKSMELTGLRTGKSTSIQFMLHNSGKQPLVIQDVKSSCGCTIPDWNKEPVKPGKETTIQVEVKPETVGYFHKTVDVYCNIEEKSIQLTITGMVEK